jgi:hypothetical protein
MAQTIDELWSLVAPPVEHTPVYKLYYDSQGYLICYSMDDLPGQWLLITAEQFAKSDSHVRVVDGKVVPLVRVRSRKLVPANEGTNCSVSSVAIVVPESESDQKWSLKTYETD